jgi:hypothetical protein
MPTAAPKGAPTNELGQASNVLVGLNDQAGYLDDTEWVDAFRFPTTFETVDRMRTDPQCAGLEVASTLPIRRYRYSIKPCDARDEVAQKLAEDVGLPILGEKPKRPLRTRDRFSFDDHARHALLARLYGLMPCEQVGRADETTNWLWRLRKLAPRMPQTLQEIKVAKDGGLVSIKQGLGRDSKPIPVNRLVYYCWDREGGNWYGRSAFRPLYGAWRAKRDLIGIDVTKHRRNGMGVPHAEATSPDVTQAQLDAAVKVGAAWRTGEHGAAGSPYGIRMRLLGVEGTLPDTLASIRYHDQQMARAWGQMFAELGSTEHGSRALGAELGDFFSLAQEAIADWFCGVFNAHVIEDWVDWNYGEDEPAPQLVYERDESPELAIADLGLMVERGLIVVDDELRTYLRERYDLPDASELPPIVEPDPEPRSPVAATSRLVQGRKHDGLRYATIRAALADPSARRREPTDREIRAATDFDTVDVQWRNTLANLLEAWEDVTSPQIDSLVEQVRAAAGDVEKLAQIEAPVLGEAVIAEAMRTAARQAAETARMEAKAQGVDLDATPVMAAAADMDPVEESIVARAAAYARRLAKSLTEAAGWKAVTTNGGDDLPGAVRDHLDGLSGSYVERRLGGALSAAQTEGRAATQAAAEEAAGGAEYDASELLDERTCGPCEAQDGETYTSLAEARKAYPGTGYIGCEGDDQCRGLLVQLLPEV